MGNLCVKSKIKLCKECKNKITSNKYNDNICDVCRHNKNKEDLNENSKYINEELISSDESISDNEINSSDEINNREIGDEISNDEIDNDEIDNDELDNSQHKQKNRHIQYKSITINVNQKFSIRIK
jgi:hypothetical protein